MRANGPALCYYDNQVESTCLPEDHAESTGIYTGQIKEEYPLGT